MEAQDIVEDAIQLTVDDELNEYNGQNAVSSPPKPETAPVIAPLTIDDTINLDTSRHRKTTTDDASMIVNVDDTQSDINDGDLDMSVMSTTASNSHDDVTKESDTEMKTPKKDDSENERKNNENAIQENDSNAEVSNNIAKDSNAKDAQNKDSSLKLKSSSKDSQSKDSKSKSKDPKSANSGKKTTAASSYASNGRNIWVSGLSQTNAKAADLQSLFSKYGTVTSSKIITNPRLPASSCYGLITMETSEQCDVSIRELNKSEFNGQRITLSRNRPQESAKPSPSARGKTNPAKRESKKESAKSETNKKELKKETESKETVKESESSDEKKITKNDDKKDEHSKDSFEDKMRDRSRSREPFRRSFRSGSLRRPSMPFRRLIRRPNYISRGGHFGTMRRPYGRAGMGSFGLKRFDTDRGFRDRERGFRDDRRRSEDLFRVQRDIERKQREERERLEREKEKIRFEREKLEREKAEILRFEREKAKIERERIEREREELRRRQTHINVSHISEVGPRNRSAIVSKRPYEGRDFRGNESYWDDRKRLQQTQRVESHIITGRQTFAEPSGSVRHGSHGFERPSDTYKRRVEVPVASSRTEFDPRRHDSRHGHDRDDRKMFYRDSHTAVPMTTSRDRRISSQRDEWKNPAHDTRRDRYAEKTIVGGSASSGFAGTSRSYATSDGRGWNDRGSSTNKPSFNSGNVHMSSSQSWNSSSGDRWNSAIGSSGGDSRNRSGTTALSTSVLSGTSIADLFTNPMPGIGLNISSHTLSGGGSIGAGDRQYIHGNRRF